MDGLGFMIWKLYDISKLYTPVQLADLLNQAKVKWVSWKVADGISRYNQVGGNDKLLMSYIDTLTAAGIESGGWAYVYPRPVSPGAQAGVISERVEKLDLKHILLDVEGEWKATAIKRADIELLLNQIDVNLKFPLGFCSYRYPQMHQGLKYNVFMNHSKMKFSAPQVYWLDMHNPDVQLQTSYNQYAAISNKPFIPIGSTFPYDDWLPTAEDFETFVAKCIASKWYTYGFYSLDWLVKHARIDWLEAISGVTITPPVEPPPTSATKVKTKAVCNVRNQPNMTVASDVGNLDANETLEVISMIGDFYAVKLLVHKSVVTPVP